MTKIVKWEVIVKKVYHIAAYKSSEALDGVKRHAFKPKSAEYTVMKLLESEQKP